MKFTHIIFDADGTLIDNETIVIKAWKDALLERFGKNYSRKDLAFILEFPERWNLIVEE